MINLLHDIRQGGELQYAATRSSRLMRIPDDFKGCVLFATYKNQRDEYVFAGTAFCFMLHDRDGNDNGFNFPYIITARHVIDAIQEHGTGGQVHLRVNTIDGGYAFITSDAADWVCDDEDPTIDVAVLPLNILDALCELSLFWISSTIAITDLMIEMEGIGIGDDVFFTGLFVNHYVNNINILIVLVFN